MRSTKDLKEIVTGARAKSKMNGIAGREYGSGYNDGDNTTAADDEERSSFDKENKMKKKRKNHILYLQFLINPAISYVDYQNQQELELID